MIHFISLTKQKDCAGLIIDMHMKSSVMGAWKHMVSLLLVFPFITSYKRKVKTIIHLN